MAGWGFVCVEGWGGVGLERGMDEDVLSLHQADVGLQSKSVLVALSSVVNPKMSNVFIFLWWSWVAYEVKEETLTLIF